MSYWTTSKLAESRMADLRSQAAQRHLSAQVHRTAVTRTGARRSRLRRRLGHILVDAGLHLLTSTAP